MSDFNYILNTATNTRDVSRWGNLGLGKTKAHLEVRAARYYLPTELIVLLQFLVTNIKRNAEFVITSDLKESDIEQIVKRYFEYPHLLSLFLYNKNLNFKLANGHVLLTTEIHDELIRKLKVQEELYSREFEQIRDDVAEATKRELEQLRLLLFPSKHTTARDEGVSFFIPCFDHLEKEQLNKTFYFYGSHSFAEDDDVSVWLKRLLRFNKLQFEIPQSIDELACLAKELMQNTDDWARSSADDTTPILPNLRAFYINLCLNPALTRIQYSSYDPIQRYLSSILNSHQSLLLTGERQASIFNDSQIGVCEISVLDTGPGMASRILAKELAEIDFQEEGDAVVRCFHKYITSEISGRKHLRGRGLSKVLKLIGNKGFISVRTNRTGIHRNFFSQNLQSEEIKNAQLEFEVTTCMSPVEGTAISILYPFLYKQKS
jgi:hypothetical protein